MNVVDIQKLHVSYGTTRAVRGISFSIPRGEVFGFIGPNGAGKSTTIKVLATLINPERGVARINGINVRDDPMKIRKMIGYMPDFFGVYDDMKV
ncbi:MAG: ATP-binding cassette domain-containing protein, partial [Planctomycetaceae bacterium]|nr:ATP-binding cassette domain-containing protein [Planctomycetaceae bacterium]